jgi:uncharacterized iron-regulated membrane protein
LKLIFIFNFKSATFLESRNRMSSLRTYLESPRQSRSRGWLFTVHLWVGLGSGVLMALMGLSGALMVFTPEIDRAGIELRADQSTSLASLQATVDRTTAMGAKVRGVRFTPSEPRLLQLDVTIPTGARRVFVDRATGRVLNAGRPAWFAFIYEFHHDLFMGRNGRIITGILGVLLTLLAVTGVVIWWPGRGRAKENPAFAPLASQRVWSWKLHNFVGFWACLLIGLLAFTGTYFTWRTQYLDFFNAVAGTATPAAPPTIAAIAGPTSAGATNLDELVSAAIHAVPDAEPTIVRFPARAGDPLTIRMRRAGDLRRIGAHSVYFNPTSGEIVRVDDFAKASAATRVVESLAALHSGEFGNGAVRALWALAGLAPPLLFVSGFALWWGKCVAVRRAAALSPVPISSNPLQPDLERS